MDECSTNNIALTRLYARALKGERAYGQAPRNWGKNITLIAALSTEGLTAAMSVEGATDAVAFETYVKHFPGTDAQGGASSGDGQSSGPQEEREGQGAH